MPYLGMLFLPNAGRMVRMEGIYRFADVTVSVRYQYDFYQKLSANYLAQGEAEEFISVTEDDIRQEAERFGETYGVRNDVTESAVIHRKLCERLIFRDILLIHASAIAKDGKAYLFLAPSGTGKSTHTRLWRKVYGDDVFMVNDDKPLLRFCEDEILVYGTPWSGKHHLDRNVSVPIGGICILGRGEHNKIWRIPARDGLAELFGSIYRPDALEGMKRMLELTSELARRIPLWKMECNMDPEAARMACEAMTSCKNEEG